MKTLLVGAGAGVAVIGAAIALARYGRSRFAKECSNAWATSIDAPAACALDAGNYNWLVAAGMGLRAITGGNVYMHYVPPGTPPSALTTLPPGQVMPPGQAAQMFMPTQAGPQQQTSAT